MPITLLKKVWQEHLNKEVLLEQLHILKAGQRIDLPEVVQVPDVQSEIEKQV